MIGRMFVYLKGHRATALLALVLASGTILAGMGLMGSSGYLISRSAERPMLVDLFMITAAVRFFGISRAVVRYFERLVSHDLAFRILMRIRTLFYERLNASPFRWMTARRPGELLAVMISDIDTLQNVYLRILSPVIVSVVICTVTFALLLFADTGTALVFLLLFIANGFLVPLFALRRARGGGKADRTARGTMKSFLVDRIQGMHDALWLEGRESLLRRQASLQRTIDEVQKRNAATSGMAEGLHQLMANLAVLASLLLVFPLVLAGQLHPALLAALVLGVFSSFEALQALPNAFVQYDAYREAAIRLHSLTTQRKEEPPVVRPQALKETEHPSIAFHDVHFSYNRNQNILCGVSFVLPPGSKTAIVGPTGSGKSTLIHLLTGLWQPGSGEIAADGQSVSKMDIHFFRSLMAVVSQDTFLFNRSVRDNLLIADRNAKDHQLAAVLQEVGLGFLTSRMDWAMGSQGLKLSGGERQLFSLARAKLKKSRIWVFDELSANMDVSTERKTLDVMWRSLGNRTLLINTHRMIDTERMDQILVIRDGKITGRGTHETLLAENTFYAAMVAQQRQVIGDRL